MTRREDANKPAAAHRRNGTEPTVLSRKEGPELDRKHAARHRWQAAEALKSFKDLAAEAGELLAIAAKDLESYKWHLERAERCDGDCGCPSPEEALARYGEKPLRAWHAEFGEFTMVLPPCCATIEDVDDCPFAAPG